MGGLGQLFYFLRKIVEFPIQFWLVYFNVQKINILTCFKMLYTPLPCVIKYLPSY
jgi:hypothetical protein